jgi:hypothetical protein
MGQMKMKCIFDIGKNIPIWSKVTQVSDVAHGPLVLMPTYPYLPDSRFFVDFGAFWRMFSK